MLPHSSCTRRPINSTKKRGCEIPVVCVESGETSSWTPIKISRSQVRAADSDTSDDNVSLDDCLSLNYQPVHVVPRFDVENC